MYQAWIAKRFLSPKQGRMGLLTWLGVVGVAIGVASLFLAMAVVSGYVTTLKTNIIDLTGHIMLINRTQSSKQMISKDIQELGGQVKAMTPFVMLEGIAASRGKISGIMIEGVELGSYKKVFNIQRRVLEGEIDLSQSQAVVVGSGLRDNLDLHVGDSLNVVIPVNNGIEQDSFIPKLLKLKVQAIVDLGRYEYNQRYLMVNMQSLNQFRSSEDKVSGYRILLQQDQKAEALSNELKQLKPQSYWAKSWKEYNANLFHAAEYEKYIIFFVLLIIIIAASVNVSIILFVSVIKRYMELSMMKVMGMTKSSIVFMFTCQGLLIGFFGAILGLCVGWLLSFTLIWVQKTWNVLPAEVYHISYLTVDIRWVDMALIVLSTLLICGLASFIPAWRGARLDSITGLRSE